MAESNVEASQQEPSPRWSSIESAVKTISENERPDRGRRGLHEQRCGHPEHTRPRAREQRGRCERGAEAERIARPGDPTPPSQIARFRADIIGQSPNSSSAAEGFEFEDGSACAFGAAPRVNAQLSFDGDRLTEGR